MPSYDTCHPSQNGQITACWGCGKPAAVLLWTRHKIFALNSFLSILSYNQSDLAHVGTGQEGRCGACVLLVGSLWASEALPLEVGPLLQYCGSSLCSTLTYICPILSSMRPIMSSLPCNIRRSCEFSRPLVGSWVHIRFLYNIGINAMLPSAICQLCAWLLCNIGTIRVKGRLSRISSVSELHRDNCWPAFGDEPTIVYVHFELPTSTG